MAVLPTLMYPKYSQEATKDIGTESQLRIIELLENIDRTLNEIKVGYTKRA